MGNINLRNKKHDSYLKDQLASGSFVSFMLFVGQVGTGRRDAAYSFAVSVLCENGDGEPCLMCAGCKLATSGNHPDFLKLGGEGSIKIAEIKALQKSLYLKPYQASHKVAIIEDAHLMTEESANALLKILEEPPKNSIIILISPDKTLLPETIVSRSQVVNFGMGDGDRIFDKELEESVSNIIEGKGCLHERFSIAHKYATDKKTTSDFLDGMEATLRNLLINGNSSELKVIRLLELVQKTRGYLKNNLSGKFVLENLIINM